MSARVEVSGESAQECARALLHRNQDFAWIRIDPLPYGMDASSDRAGFPSSASTRFRIKWQGADQSFTREVTGLKELYAVLKPIMDGQLEREQKLETLRKKIERQQFINAAKTLRKAAIIERRNAKRKLALADENERLAKKV